MKRFLGGAVLVSVASFAACGGDLSLGNHGTGATGGAASSSSASRSSSSTSANGGHGGASSSTVTSSISSTGGHGGAGGGGTCGFYNGPCTPGETMPISLCVPEPGCCDYTSGVASSSSGAGGSVACQDCGGTATCVVDTSNCTTNWNLTCEPTPLVLSFDDAPVLYRADHPRAFALDDAASLATDWPTAATPWLALDRDGNGRIDDGTELFGSMARLADGRRATNGFQALRELDTSGDGRITPEDDGFARLALWRDRDGDRRSSSEEIEPLATAGLLSIELDYEVDRRCDDRGNCEVERATFRYRDASGAVRTGSIVDVHLAARR